MVFAASLSLLLTLAYREGSQTVPFATDGASRATQVSSSAMQGASLLMRVVPNPTGRNGFEDLLRGAEVLTGADAAYVLSWRPQDARARKGSQNVPSVLQRLDRMTMLEVRRESVKLFGSSLDIVPTAIQKGIFNPRIEPSLAGYPEVEPFRRLGDLQLARAYVRAADGNRTGSVTDLLNALHVSYSLSACGKDHAYARLSVQSKAFELASVLLPGFGVSELRRIEDVADAVLRGADPMVHGVLFSMPETQKAWEQALMDPNYGAPYFKSLAQWRVVRDEIAAHREEILAGSRSTISDSFLRLKNSASLPEREWFDRSPIPESRLSVTEVKTFEDLRRMLLADLGPSENVLIDIGINRTKWRLLRLSAKLRRLGFEEGAAVGLSEKGTTPDDWFDPLSGERFVRAGAEIYSKGIPSTGEIRLVQSRTIEQGVGGRP